MINLRDKIILVAGGGGYIGSHTTLELLECGAKIIVVDNFSTSTSENYDILQSRYENLMGLLKFDIRDEDKLCETLESYGPIFAVIHFAGFKSVGESVREPLKYYDNNINSTISLLRVMKRLKVKNIIFSSSASVYGIPEKLPIPETHALNPQSPYGRTKYFIEEILKDVARTDPEMNVVILRYFNPVGCDEYGSLKEKPRGVPENLMPYIIGVVTGDYSHINIYGDDYDTTDGTGVRDYIHITDLAQGHISAFNLFFEDKIREAEGGGLEFRNENVHIYNLGTGQGYSVLEMIAAVELASGQKIEKVITERRPGDVATCYADTGKAFEELGWIAKRGLDKMCQDSL